MSSINWRALLAVAATFAFWVGLIESASAQSSCTWTRSTFTATTGPAATVCEGFATWYGTTTRPVVEVCALDEASATAIVRVDTVAGGAERSDYWSATDPACVWEPTDPPPPEDEDYMSGPQLLAVLAGFAALGILMHGFAIGRVST